MSRFWDDFFRNLKISFFSNQNEVDKIDNDKDLPWTMNFHYQHSPGPAQSYLYLMGRYHSNGMCYIKTKQAQMKRKQYA